MNKINRVQQGESYEHTFDLDGDSVSGWVCTIFVKQFNGDAPDITRIITAVGDAWPVTLTPAETAALALGLWFLVGVMVNATTGETREEPTRIGVAPTWTLTV